MLLCDRWKYLLRNTLTDQTEGFVCISGPLEGKYRADVFHFLSGVTLEKQKYA